MLPDLVRTAVAAIWRSGQRRGSDTTEGRGTPCAGRRTGLARPPSRSRTRRTFPRQAARSRRPAGGPHPGGPRSPGRRRPSGGPGSRRGSSPNCGWSQSSVGGQPGGRGNGRGLSRGREPGGRPGSGQPGSGPGTGRGRSRGGQGTGTGPETGTGPFRGHGQGTGAGPRATGGGQKTGADGTRDRDLPIWARRRIIPAMSSRGSLSTRRSGPFARTVSIAPPILRSPAWRQRQLRRRLENGARKG
jgi:hypothetical protein